MTVKLKPVDDMSNTMLTALGSLAAHDRLCVIVVTNTDVPFIPLRDGYQLVSDGRGLFDIWNERECEPGTGYPSMIRTDLTAAQAAQVVADRSAFGFATT